MNQEGGIPGEPHRSEPNRSAERELKRIVELQRNFLPQQFPSYPPLHWAAMYHPSTDVGGDYYDVIPIDENRCGVVIADVSGHGASAAVVMALTQMAVKEFLPQCDDPGEALLVLNQKLKRHMLPHHFVTMLIAIADVSRMTLSYASAGHPPMICLEHTCKSVSLLDVEPGFPLCTLPVSSYPRYERPLNSEEIYLLYTDGVVDTPDPRNRFFGDDRLMKTLKSLDTCSAEFAVQHVFEQTEQYRAGAERLDDFSLLAMEVK
ncbi:MAG: SpoIIE family protein phosphatase [bacterium]|nr:SpoIIE family protein phosphatase [bacterium]